MKSNNEKIIEILDRIGFAFLFIFAASLTTSIFVNQIGYFGALIILIIRFFIQKRLDKSPTGLEVLFILLIVSEIISAILSDFQAQAFQNTFKRAVLLPIVYMPVYYLRNEKRFKRILYSFLIFAVLGMLIYLYFSYEHFVHQLYSKESKGPSIFQYVMTAGGLMSITTIILIGFLFLRENKLRYKILLIVAVLISAASLISSYTRAAWLGTIAGIVVLFILHKRWIFLAAAAVFVALFVAFTQTESEISVFKIDYENRKILEQKNFATKGRVHGIVKLKNDYYAADYEAGLTRWKFEDNELKFVNQFQTPSPAKGVLTSDTLLFVYLLDSRILILKAEADSIYQIATIIPQNVVVSAYIHGNYLILAEGEFGISIIDITNPYEPKFVKSFSLSKGNNRTAVFGLSGKENILYALIDNKKFLILDFQDPYDIRIIREISTDDIPASINIEGNLLIIGDGIKGLKIYDISKPENPRLIRGIRTKVIPNIVKFAGDDIIFTDFGGKIYLINIHGNIFELREFKEKVSGLIKSDDFWMAAYSYRSRFSSIYDPYHPSNIERLNQIKVAFKIFADNPIFGVGNIDFNELYKKYRDPFDKYTYGHLHNNYTHILATLGIFGFLIFIILLIKIFFVHIETIKISQNRNFYNVLAKGLLAAFIGICVSGLFEYNFGDHEIATMLWFITGMSLTIQRLMWD